MPRLFGPLEAVLGPVSWIRDNPLMALALAGIAAAAVMGVVR